MVNGQESNGVPLLRLENVSVSKGRTKILENINLDIQENEIYTILGHNGAGKSSLVYAIIGVGGYKIDSGKMYYRGEDITDMSLTKKAKKGIGLTWQEPVRFEGISVREYLSASNPGASDREHEKYLESFGLKYESYIDRLIDDSLSGGERKRIELAAVFIAKPSLALLDEPDSGIDYHGIKEIQRSLSELLLPKSSIILVTHQEEIARIGSRGAIICQGRLDEVGGIDEVTSKFKNKCMGCENA